MAAYQGAHECKGLAKWGTERDPHLPFAPCTLSQLHLPEPFGPHLTPPPPLHPTPPHPTPAPCPAPRGGEAAETGAAPRAPSAAGEAPANGGASRRSRAWASVLHVNGVAVYVEEQDAEGEGGAIMVCAQR